MGTLRFFLSILVLLSHAGVSIHGYNPGVVAVMTFFIMSGYVMTLLVQRHYSTADRMGHFYLDRAARLFPQFLLYSCLTLALLSLGLISSAYLSECTADKITLNMAILPVGYYSSLGLSKCMVIPQAWSLGLEATFYAAVPIILFVVPRDWLRGVLVASMAVFSLAVLGAIGTDQWGYRLLPGTLLFFMAGMALADPCAVGKQVPVAVVGFAVLLFILCLLWPPLYRMPYNKEVLLGVILGVPLVAALRVLPPAVRTDKFLGDLSYGVFLNHFIFLWLAQAYAGTSALPAAWLVAVIGASVMASAVSYGLVERPALTLRHHIRYVRADAERVA